MTTNTPGGKKSEDVKAKNSEEALASPTEPELPTSHKETSNEEIESSRGRKSKKDEKSRDRHNDESKSRHRSKSSHRRKSDKSDDGKGDERSHREKSSKEEQLEEDNRRHRSKSSSRHRRDSSRGDDKKDEERRHSRSSSRHKRKSTKGDDKKDEERHHSRSSSRHRRKSVKEEYQREDDEEKSKERSRSSHRRQSETEGVTDEESSQAKKDREYRKQKKSKKSDRKDKPAMTSSRSSSYHRPPLTSTVTSLISTIIEPQEESIDTIVAEPVEVLDQSSNNNEVSIDEVNDPEIYESVDNTSVEQDYNDRKLQFDFQLDDVINNKENCKEDMDNGNYEAAFSQSSDEMKLGPNIYFLKFLMRHYENSVMTQRIEQATEAKNQLASLLRNNVRTNANEIKNMATKLASSKQYISSFLLFQIASVFFERELPPKESINETRLCCWEIKEICRRMIDDEEEAIGDGKSFISQLVLGMLELKDRITALKRVPIQLQGVCQSHCCYYIALCLGWDEKYKQSEIYWDEAIAIADKVFADKASLYKYYGDLKSNLGYIYECQSRFEDAVLMYNQSINAVSQATDFQSTEEKTACIDTLNGYIKDIKASI